MDIKEEKGVININQEKNVVFCYNQTMKNGIPCEYRKKHDYESGPWNLDELQLHLDEDCNQYTIDSPEITHKKILFCPHCRKPADVKDYFFSSSYIKCPNCGEEFEYNG